MSSADFLRRVLSAKQNADSIFSCCCCCCFQQGGGRILNRLAVYICSEDRFSNGIANMSRVSLMTLELDIVYIECLSVKLCLYKRNCLFRHAQNAQIRIVLRIHAVPSGSLLAFDIFCRIQWFWTDCEGPDQTARMRSLIWAFAVRIWLKRFFRLTHVVQIVVRLSLSLSLSLTLSLSQGD